MTSTLTETTDISLKVNRLIFDPSSFGITSKSLKLLRNTIAGYILDEILVIQVASSDICCGYLILNKTRHCAVWSGDGFRTDGGGEGGRGQKNARQLLEMFGLSYTFLESVSSENMFKNVINSPWTDEQVIGKALLKAANKVWDECDETEYKSAYYETPKY